MIAGGSVHSTVIALVEVVQIPFFVSGTSIETTNGSVLIENITAGMYVHTHDYGLKMVRWIGNSTIFNNPKQRPIRIKEGSFGATSDLLVSPQHRVLVEGCWGGTVVWRNRGAGKSQGFDPQPDCNQRL